MSRRIIHILLILFFLPRISGAATLYVRPDGGDLTECLGTTDAAYPGSGTGQACAFEHPFWVLGVDANCDVTAGRQYSGGDTVNIKYDASGYKMGYGAPNTHAGASSFPWDCHMLPILDGIDASNKTKIYGSNHASCSADSSKTELYAVERSEYVLALIDSDNVDIQCLLITDHSDVRYQSQLNDGDVADTGSYPFGDYGYKGIESTASNNVELHNITITGMASEGASIDTPSNWIIDEVDMIANAGINWNFNGTGASGTTDQATGTMAFTGGLIAFAGCTGVYPRTSSDYDGVTIYDPKRCCSQDQGCAADGLGTESNSADWSFDGTKVKRNVADGIDLLYHDQGSGTVTVNNAKIFKNSGNQLKAGGNTVIKNTAIDADCLSFQGQSYTWEYAGNCRTWDGTNQSTCETGHAGCEWNSAASQCLNFSDHCRASGNAVALAFQSNTDVNVEGVTIVNTVSGEPFLIVARNLANCAANNLLVIKNGIFTTLNGLNWIGVDSSCTSATVTQDHSVIYGFTTNPSGTGNVFTNPSLSGAIAGSDANFLIPSTGSSAYNIADETAANQGSDDMFGFARGANWDPGAIEYGSTDPDLAGATCGNNTKESGEACDGSDLDSQSCASQGFASGTLSCAGDCLSFVTSSCVAASATGRRYIGGIRFSGQLAQ